MVSINCESPEICLECSNTCIDCGEYIESETESYMGCEDCLNTYSEVSNFKELLEQNLSFFSGDLCQTPYRVELMDSEKHLIPELVELNKNGFYTNRLVKSEKFQLQDKLIETKHYISCTIEDKYLEKLVTYLEMTPELRFIIGKYNQTNITNIQNFPFPLKKDTYENGNIETPMNIWNDEPFGEAQTHHRFFPKILNIFKNCFILNLTTVGFHSNLDLSKILIDFKKYYV